MKSTEIKNEYLTMIARSCKAHIALIDSLMREPETAARFKKIAAEQNRFEMDVDRYLHFGMGLSFDDMKKILRHNWKYTGHSKPKK